MRKKVLLIVLFVLLILIIGIGILLSSNREDFTTQNRTEIQPIIDRFPKLQKINKVYWKSEMIGNTNFGPSSYSLKGYVYLDEDVAKRFAELHNWNKVDINPSIQLDNNETNRTWVFSKEFNEYIKSSDYVGDFYFDINNRLIYFEVER